MREAVTAKIKCRRKKFKDIGSALCKKAVSFKLRGRLYNSFVRSAFCYGVKCWALRKDGKEIANYRNGNVTHDMLKNIKKRWKEVLKNGMLVRGLRRTDALNRSL